MRNTLETAQLSPSSPATVANQPLHNKREVWVNQGSGTALISKTLRTESIQLNIASLARAITVLWFLSVFNLLNGLNDLYSDCSSAIHIMLVVLVPLSSLRTVALYRSIAFVQICLSPDTVTLVAYR
ncbi:hypothetical protein ASPBRDRAFT_466819 [Aspergillus brasiliensis CBS 101740]|uniref:Uncharacterized protein n=1 Tax=Aspergillus brasiliensis (strain CBS 101740 / IMI 381727 / IBT 21946) TaxID=767769 RepID=A0A1L9UTA0_ASPBC|nr:hypothetical protein ASPBRDRAFT_466819 [Aspergillus brasiliensis CBS 101740]